VKRLVWVRNSHYSLQLSPSVKQIFCVRNSHCFLQLSSSYVSVQHDGRIDTYRLISVSILYWYWKYRPSPNVVYIVLHMQLKTIISSKPCVQFCWNIVNMILGKKTNLFCEWMHLVYKNNLNIYQHTLLIIKGFNLSVFLKWRKLDVKLTWIHSQRTTNDVQQISIL